MRIRRVVNSENRLKASLAVVQQTIFSLKREAPEYTPSPLNQRIPWCNNPHNIFSQDLNACLKPRQTQLETSCWLAGY